MVRVSREAWAKRVERWRDINAHSLSWCLGGSDDCRRARRRRRAGETTFDNLTGDSESIDLRRDDDGRGPSS
jgi:hypothetical protein